ncbi:MAG: FAD synthase [Alistipes senegalensis]|nr:FAD synthase [Bacteroides cellulosilyticus]MCM1352207.1 FAD synthase [Alistipes senegalensis]
MRIFRGFDALPHFRHPAVTVGTFDGVHAGHRALLECLVAEARALNGESVVLTFDPHPRITLGRADDLYLLTTLDEKAALLESLGVDAMVVIPFDRAFSALSGAEFVERILLGRIEAETLVAGYDHRFGHDRCDCETAVAGRMKVVRVAACEVNGQRVSSTVIRRLLAEGKRTEAEKLAGHELKEKSIES